MKFLITGGAGSVGLEITLSLLAKGHYVKVLDKDISSIEHLQYDNLEKIESRIEDPAVLRSSIQDVDIVVHLAWSFSNDPFVLMEEDIKSHLMILEESVAAKVSHFFYTSTAVVYGKPVSVPVTEESPCLVEEARKPFYGIVKLTAEKFCLAYWKMKGLPVTIFRFWWAFGRVIGGRHLRDMIKTATLNNPIFIPENSGGSFLHTEDLVNAILKATCRKETFGEIFNLSTVYLEWKDVAHIIKEVTGSSSSVSIIPSNAWKGPEFFKDIWDLGTEKAVRLFNYSSLFSPSEAVKALKEAISACYRKMKN